MLNFETLNELTLKVTSTGNDVLFTKAGAFIGGECQGGKNYQFEKVLLGPQGNLLRAALGQLARRVTGENLPLMKVTMQGESVTYYANEAQHVVSIKLNYGETLSVESENILAFTSDCAYGVRFLAQGIISQKGLMTSTLKGAGPNAIVAVLVDGNPIVLSNVQSGATLEVDPDVVVCWIGNSDPGFKLDLSWKNIIGQASGESYMFEWAQGTRTTVIIQPNERRSGVDISIDTGIASRQQNQSFGQALGGIGDMFGGADNNYQSGRNNGGGLDEFLGNIFGN